MTGRSDHGSQSWRYPQTLSYVQTYPLRRGTQQDILRALRHLLSRPTVGRQVTRPDAAALGTTVAPGEVTR